MPSNELNTNTKYIIGFDSLRAFSVILVLLQHLNAIDFLTVNTSEILPYIFSGGVGVRVFFTLSGFLITQILINEKEKNGKINFKNFFIRRFLRLLPPLIIFYTIIAILMYFKLIHTTSVGFLFSFFYLYNFVPNTPYYTIELAHTWSLAVEEQFYLMWPFVLNYFKNLFITNLFIPLILVLCVLAYYLLPTYSFADNFKVERWFIPAVAPIMVGSFFAIINKNNKLKWAVFFYQNKLILIVSFLLFIFPIFVPKILLNFYNLIQPIGIAIFLIWILHNQKSRLTILLGNKYSSYIGKISYGIYVYQGLFLTTGIGGNLVVQSYPYNILLTIIVSIISYEIMEKPILKLKRYY